MLILDLLGIGFHAVVVFGLGKDLLFKSVLLGHCDREAFSHKFARLYMIFGKISGFFSPADKDMGKLSVPSISKEVLAIGCHKKIHNKTKAIQCSECNKAYNHKRSYAEHLLKVHNIVYQWAQ